MQAAHLYNARGKSKAAKESPHSTTWPTYHALRALAFWSAAIPSPLCPAAVKQLVHANQPFHPDTMPDLATLPWPHAPSHELTSSGTFFVTAATYQKEHFFRKPERLDALQQHLLTLLQQFGWRLEAWAVFSNHYHFVAHSPNEAEDARSLSTLLGRLHRRTARCVNDSNHTVHRKVWHNFWDSRLSYQKSYLARLNYVHQNAVRHGLVPVANQYPWCSARWLERVAAPAMVQAIYRFKMDKVHVPDDFSPILED